MSDQSLVVTLVMAFAAVIQVAATVVLVWITKGYAQSTNEMVDQMAGQRLDGFRPVVSLQDFRAERQGVFSCTVSNLGSGPAFDLRCQVNSVAVEYDIEAVGSLA